MNRMAAAPGRIIIVGGGVAAGHAAVRLRELGWDGSLTLATAEAHPPYERPPLSKSLLLTGRDPATTYVRTTSWYAEHDIELRTDARVTAVDPRRRTVRIGDDDLPFDRLLLATGSQPRLLPMDLLRGSTGPALISLRTIEDGLRIRAAIEAGARIAIVGGGWIGLEIAAAARTWGCEVFVIERDTLLLRKVLGARVARRFADLHREHAATLCLGAELRSVEAGFQAGRVRLADGTVIEADVVVVAIGAEPETSLARSAGLEVGRGIRTDATLESSVSGIFAAGDAAEAFNPRYGTWLRLEHWDNALRQGDHVAGNLLGEARAYDRAPYFYTDQHELGMEYVGHVPPDAVDDVVVRGEIDSDEFAVLWMAGDVVTAGMHVNRWDDMEAITRLVESGRRGVDRSRLADSSTAWDDVWS